MRALVEEARGAVMDAGRPDAVARQHKRGQLTARERIAKFFDDGTFREQGALVQSAQETEVDAGLVAPADGVIVGSGYVAGRAVAVTASDSTVVGGSGGTIGGQKQGRVIRLAVQQGTPLVRLLEGGGHRIQEGLDARHFAAAAGNFQTLCDASGWIPMAAGIFGPGFAGPSNHAAMSDFVVMVRGRATLGVAGPALVKAATGEDIDKEDLGGAKVQVDQYGIADLAVDTEEECLEAIRQFLSYLPSNAGLPPPSVTPQDTRDRQCEELLDIVPLDRRSAYDMRRVIEVVADPGSVFEIKPTFARNLITAFARLNGKPVGILANNPKQLAGTINAAACEKGSHFIEMCDAFGLPLIYLVDVPGFLIGTAAEKSGLARRSAKLIHALGGATVPRVSVVLRKGYGLGYYAMCGGRLFEPDGCVAWPTAEICAMSVEGAVDVVYKKEYEKAADPKASRNELIEDFRSRLGPLRAAEHFGIDDGIDPAFTRQYLIETLAKAPARRERRGPPKHRSIAPI
jgi:propionyl-CoA carboxylase beta chain